MALSSNLMTRVLTTSDTALGALFGETQARFLIAVSADKAEAFAAHFDAADVIYQQVGDFIGEDFSDEPGIFLSIDDPQEGDFISLATLRDAHEGWMPKFMSGE